MPRIYQDKPVRPPRAGLSPALSLAGVSFLGIYWELVMIRWLPSHIPLVAFFTNMALLASFLGLGVGCLLARKKDRVQNLFLPLLLSLQFFVFLHIVSVAFPTTTAEYFLGGRSPAPWMTGLFTPAFFKANAFWFVPAIFAVVAFLFLPLGQSLGIAFSEVPRRRAYLLNLSGGLLAVFTFAFMTAHMLPSAVWFFFGLLGWAAWRLSRTNVRWLRLLDILLCLLSFFLAGKMDRGSAWSPYYRINQMGKAIFVNGIFHQAIVDLEKDKRTGYEAWFNLLGFRAGDVLILGAGAGNDVAGALKNGATSVDAVEIDPLIATFGLFHPNKPYEDKRVNIHIQDARAYLSTTQKRYDTIIVGLLDALTLSSPFSNVRLDNFTYTRESFQAMKRCLKPNGVVLLHHFHPRWLMDRISNLLLREIHNPVIEYRGVEGSYTLLAAGHGIDGKRFPQKIGGFTGVLYDLKLQITSSPSSLTLPSDSWPFLYMKKPALPFHTILFLTFMLVFGAVLIGFSGGWPKGKGIFESLFLGMAFMLLETMAIVRFSLLFGSTWQTNVWVIAAVLFLAGLGAIAASFYKKGWFYIFSSGRTLYGLLLLAAILQAFLPWRGLLEMPAAQRGLSAAAIFLLPIPFASALFGLCLSRSRFPSQILAANLFGGMIGGCLEYMALLSGYSFLVFVVVAAYVAAAASRLYPLRSD